MMTDRSVAEAVSAVQRGDLRTGFERAASAIEAGERHPVLYKLRAALREQQGRMVEAVDDFRSALDMAPEDFSALNGLGLCLARSGQLDEGVAALKRSVEIQPAFAPAHFNLGWAQEASGDLVGARASYEAALNLDPALARAAGALAMLAVRRGDWAGARALAGRTLQGDPRQTTANLTLALADMHDGRLSEAHTRLEQLLDGDLAAPSNERSLALGAKGDLLDRQGRYAEAFAAYGQAKAVVREMFASIYEHPDRPGSPQILDRIIEHYRDHPRADGPRRPSPAKVTHAFLLGFPRSGTTLLGQVLNTHPDVVTLEESERLAGAANAFLMSAEGLDRLDAATEEQLEPFRALYWDRLRAAGVEPGGRLLVDKLPTNTMGLPLIAKLFPDSLVIFMERDPRDVVLSCLRRQFVINPATWELLSPRSAASFLGLSLTLGQLMRARGELAIHVQIYERLVADFEGEIAGLCKVLGLDPTAISALPERLDVSAVATPSAVQITEGLNARSIGHWRAYREQLEPVLPQLAPWVQAMGYA